VLGPHSRRQSTLTNQDARSKCRKDAFLSFQKQPSPCLTGISKVAIPDLLCRADNQVQKTGAAVHSVMDSSPLRSSLRVRKVC
jgi:hypothetical protein